MTTITIQCFTCGFVHSSSYTAMSCSDCGGLLEVKHHWQLGDTDTDKLKSIFQARLGEPMTPMASGVWRYKELICPALPDEQIVTRYEGNTELYNVES